jgi:uncharacterized protein YbaP (TraB family)
MYLLGSIHFSNESLYPLPTVVTDAFASSRTLVLEVDMGAVQSPAFALKMMQEGMYHDDERISDHLSKETFALLEKGCETTGFPVHHFLRFKPWYCANFLMVSALRKAGYDPLLGLDMHFYQRAVREGKRIVGLETPEFQLGLFAGLSETEADEFLRQALVELADIRTFADKLLGLWSAGDAAGIAAIIEESFADADELYDKILVQRNRAWVHELGRLADEEGDVFVVVGAGHMMGTYGLIDMLAKEGHKPVQL